MKHKVRVTVIDKKLYPELQKQYCKDPDAGICPVYHVGDVYEFYRDEEKNHFWHGGHGLRHHRAALRRLCGDHAADSLGHRPGGRPHHHGGAAVCT